MVETVEWRGKINTPGDEGWSRPFLKLRRGSRERSGAASASRVLPIKNVNVISLDNVAPSRGTSRKKESEKRRARGERA